ncbi:MAG: cation-transporting P-type ATPase, partial [Micropruina sp.]
MERPAVAGQGDREATSRWHNRAVEDVYAATESGPSGLSWAESAARLERYGRNEITAARRLSPWRILAQQFRNVLILILLAATALSFVMGHAVEPIVIAVIVLFAIVLGFVQEYRAERAIEALRELTTPTASVLREGGETEIPTRDLVPGDVILLHVGDRVPAEARVVESINLRAEEAPLTGESVAVRKHADSLENGELAVGDRRNMVHA